VQNIKLTIEYDGTEYCGWQKQKNGPSIQGHIEKALRIIFGERIKTVGAARTDSGVHALQQTANFKTSSKLPSEKIEKALNSNLPKDIVISKCVAVGDKFNAQFSAKSRIYQYLIWNGRKRSPLNSRFSFHFAHKLNETSMKKAAALLLGKHDFSSFKGSKGVTKNQIRTITNISVKRKNDFIIIDIEADGFLYNMVRNIVGTFIEVGKGKMKPEVLKHIISLRDRRIAGPTAPACGLTLLKVKY